MRERVGARSLVLLAAAPLLGVAPMQDANGGTRAEGPAPTARDQRAVPGKPKPPADPKTKPGPKAKPRSEAKPKPGTKPKSKDGDTGVVRLSMVGPGQTVIPGRAYNWPFAVTVKAAAKGRGKARPAVLRATFPKTLKFVSGQSNCTSGKAGKAGKDGTAVCRLGLVKPGQTVPGVLRARVAKRTKAGRTVTPNATVTWGKARTKRTFPASRVARTVDLVMSKKAPATARAGAAIPYVTKVRNLGPSTAKNVVVRSKGRARLIGRHKGCKPDGAGYACAVGSLRPGEARTLRTKVMPDASARAGTTVESPSTATTSTIDVDTANNQAVARTRITGETGGSTGTGRPTATDGSTGASRPTGTHGTTGTNGTTGTHGTTGTTGTNGMDGTNGAAPRDASPAAPAARDARGVQPLAYAPGGAARPAEAAGGASLTGTRTGTVVEIAVAMVGAGFVLTRLGRRRRARAAHRG